MLLYFWKCDHLLNSLIYHFDESNDIVGLWVNLHFNFTTQDLEVESKMCLKQNASFRYFGHGAVRMCN